MRMKAKYYLLPLAFLLGSCTTDFLEVAPTTIIPEEDSYQTETDIYKALMSAYAPLLALDFCRSDFTPKGEYHPYQFISDILADDYNAVGGSGPGDCPYLQLMFDYRLTPEQSLIALWEALYKGIYRSNIVVNRIGDVTGISQANQVRYVAEARFLRAFYYHVLWKFWGAVPYYSVNPDGKQVSYIVPQISADELYAKIMEDLDWCTAENRLPEAVTLTQVGRVNRFGAYMLRADVVMLQQDATSYGSVLSQLQELIGSDIYALTPKFEDIWADEGEWNCESIWEINYSDNPSNREWGDEYAPGGTIYPTFICPDSYKGSRFAREGYGFGPVSVALKAAFEAEDQRRDASIMDFNTDAVSGEKYNKRQGDTGLFNKKYMGRAGGYDQYIGSNSPELNFRNNLRIYRYSEALLRAAELLVRTGGSQTQADAYLNEVRARAFRVKPEALGDRARTATLDNLLGEYRLEFALEGHRFFDLVRFGQAETVLSARGYTAQKRYLPIPQSEIDRSDGTLKQNNY